MRSVVAPLLALMRPLNGQLTYSDATIEHLAVQDPRMPRLRSVPSIGPVTAAAFLAAIDDAQRFRHAHQLEAYLGLVLLLQKEFSGILPYAWDTWAVKFKFIPCHAFDPEKFPFDHKDPRYQMKMIAQFLAGAEACYRMRVQVRPDRLPDQPAGETAAAAGETATAAAADPRANPLEKLFPIEDATAYWPEGNAPAEVRTGGGAVRASADFEDVGTIRIKQGTAPLAHQTCEALAYNPWRGLKAHQPLGSLSRARLVVYRQSERVRREIYREQALQKP